MSGVSGPGQVTQTVYFEPPKAPSLETLRTQANDHEAACDRFKHSSVVASQDNGAVARYLRRNPLDTRSMFRHMAPVGGIAAGLLPPADNVPLGRGEARILVQSACRIGLPKAVYRAKLAALPKI